MRAAIFPLSNKAGLNSGIVAGAATVVAGTQPKLGDAMEELAITWPRVMSVWWLIFWRGAPRFFFDCGSHRLHHRLLLRASSHSDEPVNCTHYGRHHRMALVYCRDTDSASKEISSFSHRPVAGGLALVHSGTSRSKGRSRLCFAAASAITPPSRRPADKGCRGGGEVLNQHASSRKSGAPGTDP